MVFLFRYWTFTKYKRRHFENFVPHIKSLFPFFGVDDRFLKSEKVPKKHRDNEIYYVIKHHFYLY